MLQIRSFDQLQKERKAMAVSTQFSATRHAAHPRRPAKKPARSVPPPASIPHAHHQAAPVATRFCATMSQHPRQTSPLLQALHVGWWLGLVKR
jgi:hypothetical protein